MYDSPSMPESSKINYPSIDLPLSIIDGLDIKVDDEVMVVFTGRVSGMRDERWSKSLTIEAQNGEVTKKSADKKGDSVLDKA